MPGAACIAPPRPALTLPMPMNESLTALLDAIDAGDDERAEQAALHLTAADVPALLTLAHAADSDRRWWAVRGLAVCAGAEAVPALLANLGDSDAGVRAATVMALAFIHQRAPAAVEPHLDEAARLLADDDGMVRQAAADTLAQCGDDAVPALARVIFQGDHQGARTRAAAALRKIATMKAAAVLYPMLNDPNHMVRAYAYEGLDEMGLLENILVTLE